MSKWLMRLYTALLSTYLSYLFVVAAIQTACDCLSYGTGLLSSLLDHITLVMSQQDPSHQRSTSRFHRSLVSTTANTVSSRTRPTAQTNPIATFVGIGFKVSISRVLLVYALNMSGFTIPVSTAILQENRSP